MVSGFVEVSMRSVRVVRAFAGLVVVGSVACGSPGEDTADDSCEDGSEPVEWFPDFDGDRWGSIPPELDGGVMACSAGEASLTLADMMPTNTDWQGLDVSLSGKDCADDSVDISGKIGTRCPQDLVPDDGDVLVTASVAAGYEIAVVHDSADQLALPVTAATAAERCKGWSPIPVELDLNRGALFAPVDNAGLWLGETLLGALLSGGHTGTREYEGFVGAVSYRHAGPAGTDGFYWEAVGETGQVIYSEVTEQWYCGQVPDAETVDRLALRVTYDDVVDRREACLDAPAASTSLFVCGRAVPRASDYPGRP